MAKYKHQNINLIPQQFFHPEKKKGPNFYQNTKI
jgi:hypothetical protein